MGRITMLRPGTDRGRGSRGLRAAVGLLALLFAVPAAGAAAERPNIVFILVDDLRWDSLGITGHPFVKTPQIDRIGREGAVFRNAFVTTPLCSPARASFLTGRYVHAHEILGNGDNNARSHRLDTFPKRLHDAGYETAYVGKWHMGNDDSPRPGFDRWVSFKGQGVYDDPQINIDGESSKVEGYMTDILNEKAVEFLRKPREKPFLLYLSHKAIHGPFTPADRHKGEFADRRIEPPPSADDDLEGKPMLTREVDDPRARAKAKAKAPEKAKAKAKSKAALPPLGGGTAINQLRCMLSVDDGVGLILEALEDTGKLADTLVIFTSDNGYFWGEHGMGDKRAAYEEALRIPLLMRKPGLIPAGTTIDAPVLNIDIAPTLLDLAGLPIPDSIHGHTILPLIHHPAPGWRGPILFEYFAEAGFPRVPSWHAIRTDRWKYIHYPDMDGLDELYKIETDPHELKNRIDDPAARDELAKLKADLARSLERTK